MDNKKKIPVGANSIEGPNAGRKSAEEWYNFLKENKDRIDVMSNEEKRAARKTAKRLLRKGHLTQEEYDDVIQRLQ